MLDNTRTAALIVAAGRGSRMGEAGDGQAKQYADLAGVTVLGWALKPFLEHPGIRFVQVVIHPDDQALYARVIAQLEDPESRLQPVVPGGATRQASTVNGLVALEALAPSTVMIHDAARPFLSARIIDALLDGLTQHAGIVPALEVADTLKQVSASGLIEGTVPRENIWRAQTPQAFHFAGIYAAHEAVTAGSRHCFTDDASIAGAASLEVKVVPGDDDLRKLTTPADLAWARSRARQMAADHDEEKPMSEMEPRVGQGFDVHAFADGDSVTLCGVTIPFTRCLSGHSDADVGLHALTDAILGALADGDIGSHFPPSDPQWRGTNSAIFLEDAVQRVAARGGRIRHIDITLICEQPKIGPHRGAMTRRVSDMLGIAVDRVSIKATTTERLGFTGREEGIAALVTATLALPHSE